jgi:hypothetical protein
MRLFVSGIAPQIQSLLIRLWDAYHFRVWGNRFRLSVHSYLRYRCLISSNLYNRRIRRVRYAQPLGGSGSISPCQDAVSTQATGTNMRTVETPSATGTRWRRTLSQLYRMIEAAETSPLGILYDRVLQLEQEVSALKRNLPIGSPERE